MNTFALALPHCPWIPERVRSHGDLLSQLGIHEHDDLTDAEGYGECSGDKPIDHGMCCTNDGPDYLEFFQDRESNKVWPRKMWGWGLETKASHLLQLQDDVLVAPNFWPALRAMVAAVPEAVIALSAVHPVGPEIARQGHRWYRTETVVGWAYVIPHIILVEFLAWVDANPELVATLNEDDLLSRYLQVSGRMAWTPCPTICDHDVSIASTYQNDSHTHRRATVTWHGYDAAVLEDVAWWKPQHNPPVLPAADWRKCWFCLKRPESFRSGVTGGSLCNVCLVEAVAGKLGLLINAGGVK
jgi:hypothetical protein